MQKARSATQVMKWTQVGVLIQAYVSSIDRLPCLVHLFLDLRRQTNFLVPVTISVLPAALAKSPGKVYTEFIEALVPLDHRSYICYLFCERLDLVSSQVVRRLASPLLFACNTRHKWLPRSHWTQLFVILRFIHILLSFRRSRSTVSSIVQVLQSRRILYTLHHPIFIILFY